MLRSASGCLLLLLAMGALRPAAAAPGNDLERQAERVSAAVAAGDAEALATLAGERRPDPWRVAEFLLLAGRASVATAYARALSDEAFAGLGAYVAEHAGVPAPSTASRATDLQREAYAREDAGDGPGALLHIEAAAVALAAPERILGLGLELDRGRLLALAGRPEEARPLLGRVLSRTEALGWLGGAAAAWQALAICAQDPPDHAALVEAYTSEAGLRERVGDDVNAAKALSNLAAVHGTFGDYVAALPVLERATELLGPYVGEPANAFTLAHLLWTKGAVYERMGESASAAATLQRCLRLLTGPGSEEAIAEVLGSLGDAHQHLADYDTALGYQRRLLELQTKRGDEAGIGRALRLRGQVAYWRGEIEEARDSLTQARARFQAAQEARYVLYTDIELAECMKQERRFQQAAALLERALQGAADLDDPLPLAHILAQLGEVQVALGEADAALRLHTRGLDEARAWGQSSEVVHNLTGLARAEAARGHHPEAIRHAREAVAALPVLLRGATAAQAPRARERRSAVFDIGLRSALAANDLESLCFFLESGRAGALLESITTRDAFRRVAVPEGLQAKHLQARRTVADAQQALREARDRRERLPLLRARRKVLDDAVARLQAIDEQIELEARFGVSLLYPQAASLPSLQADLQPHEVLVLYRLLPEEAIALVVPGGEAKPHVVHLGPTEAVEAAGAALRSRLRSPEASADTERARLVSLVATPLKLPAGTLSVLVSPDGALAQIPPALLFDQDEVGFIPSGTALGALEAEAGPPAAHALALGDPAYDRASGMPRLSSTRAEIAAVPEPAMRLVGQDASVASFRAALRAQPRWRVVHLACHGVLRDDPWGSALALTPMPDHDGLLTALDVAALEVPSDLVVLSACNSGRGTVVAGEGLVGLTHGFLCAGARRVVVGLWKVDDEATGALMAAFHDTLAGGKVPVSTALRRAQAQIRAQAKWKHPYYWAAWVRWGAAR
jgi:CHAT domain-containing protein